MSMALALAGKEAIETKTKAHRDAIAKRGYGTHYGDHSVYTPPAGVSLIESSCVVWAMECARYAFNKVNQGPQWKNIASITRRNQLRGTVLIQQLLTQARWTGIYWNPDTRYGGDNGEHSFSASVVKSRKTYYDIPVSGTITNYNPSSDTSTKEDTSGLEALAKVPFWIGCARGGRHVFCGTGAQVSEFHWEAPATNTHAMELVDLKTYEWLSGIVAIPPTVWATATS